MYLHHLQFKFENVDRNSIHKIKHSSRFLHGKIAIPNSQICHFYLFLQRVIFKLSLHGDMGVPLCIYKAVWALEARPSLLAVIFIIILFLPFSCTNATGRISWPILTKKNTQMQLKGYIVPLKILKLSVKGLRADNSKLIPKKIRFLPISPLNISRFASNLLYGRILPIPTKNHYTTFR